jgi:hypothetical protein
VGHVVDSGLTVLLDEVVEIVRVEEEPPADPDARDLAFGAKPPHVTLTETRVRSSIAGIQEWTPCPLWPGLALQRLYALHRHAASIPAGGFRWGPDRLDLVPDDRLPS